MEGLNQVGRRQPLRLGLLGLLLGLIPSCRETLAGAPPPNVVLLVLDTVRADHVSCYGYDRPTTPHVDALAESAVLYSECRATGPWTLPSHASMFTGRFAFQHRADLHLSDDGHWRELPLKSEYTTLAEALRGIGYRTGAFVANTAYLREEFQLHQGFDHYMASREPGTALNKAALAWMDGNQGPFFLFLNYMDAHRPYNTQALENGRLAEYACHGEDPSNLLLDQLCDVVLRDGLAAPPELVEELTACYDLGIANADLAVGEIVAELRHRGLWENTLLIVTSDHGEFLGEHGLVEHSKDIYEPVMHVPLVCKLPGVNQGSVNDTCVSLADMPRIVASGLPGPLRDELHELFPLSMQREVTIAEIVMSRERDLRASYGSRFLRQRQALYAGGHKLIISSDGQHELFDLEQDPGESRNLYDPEQELSKEMTARLEAYVKEHPPEYSVADAPVFDEEAMRALQELGYAGSSED